MYTSIPANLYCCKCRNLLHYITPQPNSPAPAFICPMSDCLHEYCVYCQEIPIDPSDPQYQYAVAHFQGTVKPAAIKTMAAIANEAAMSPYPTTGTSTFGNHNIYQPQDIYDIPMDMDPTIEAEDDENLSQIPTSEILRNNQSQPQQPWTQPTGEQSQNSLCCYCDCPTHWSNIANNPQQPGEATKCALHYCSYGHGPSIKAGPPLGENQETSLPNNDNNNNNATDPWGIADMITQTADLSTIHAEPGEGHHGNTDATIGGVDIDYIFADQARINEWVKCDRVTDMTGESTTNPWAQQFPSTQQEMLVAGSNDGGVMLRNFYFPDGEDGGMQIDDDDDKNKNNNDDNASALTYFHPSGEEDHSYLNLPTDAANDQNFNINPNSNPNNSNIYFSDWLHTLSPPHPYRCPSVNRDPTPSVRNPAEEVTGMFSLPETRLLTTTPQDNYPHPQTPPTPRPEFATLPSFPSHSPLIATLEIEAGDGAMMMEYNPNATNLYCADDGDSEDVMDLDVNAMMATLAVSTSPLPPPQPQQEQQQEKQQIKLHYPAPQRPAGLYSEHILQQRGSSVASQISAVPEGGHTPTHINSNTSTNSNSDTYINPNTIKSTTAPPTATSNVSTTTDNNNTFKPTLALLTPPSPSPRQNKKNQKQSFTPTLLRRRRRQQSITRNPSRATRSHTSTPYKITKPPHKPHPTPTPTPLPSSLPLTNSTHSITAIHAYRGSPSRQHTMKYSVEWGLHPEHPAGTVTWEGLRELRLLGGKVGDEAVTEFHRRCGLRTWAWMRWAWVVVKEGEEKEK